MMPANQAFYGLWVQLEYKKGLVFRKPIHICKYGFPSYGIQSCQGHGFEIANYQS